MLKQHFAETQHLSIVTPSPTAQIQESKTAGTHVTAGSRSSVCYRLLPPLYLSRQQLVTNFAIPLLWTLLLIVMQWVEALLSYVTRNSEPWVYLRIAVFTVVPWLLCLGVGYYLRNRRIAVLSGAICGVLFYLATRLNFWQTTRFIVHPILGPTHGTYHRYMNLRWLPISTEERTYGLLFCLILTLGAAVVSRMWRGRRTMYDKDNNR